MARMPRVFRLLAVCALIAVVAGSAARLARGAESGGAAAETPLPPWPGSAAAYQPPPVVKAPDPGVAPIAATAPNTYVQQTSYVTGPVNEPKATPAAPAPSPTTQPATALPSAPATKGTPLPPPSRRVDPAQSQASGTSPASRPGALPSLFTLVGSLGVVIALFLAAAWALRRTTGAHVATLPKDVVEVLGRVPLGGRQQVHLLRVGRKLILVAVSQAGMETLTEITDAMEVDRLAGLCQQTRPDSATTVFRNVLAQVGMPSTMRRRAQADELRLSNISAPQFVDEYQESHHA
jgi:flagellar biogenesis protein FliO